MRLSRFLCANPPTRTPLICPGAHVGSAQIAPLGSCPWSQISRQAKPPGPPDTVDGRLTDCTISPALSMPYNGGRVIFASRASLSDGGRGTYAKWYMRSPASSDGIHKELTRKGRSGDSDWTRGKALCHNKAESEVASQVQLCANSFTGARLLPAVNSPTSTSFIERVFHCQYQHR
jgi:hypothetical protein